MLKIVFCVSGRRMMKIHVSKSGPFSMCQKSAIGRQQFVLQQVSSRRLKLRPIRILYESHDTLRRDDG